MDTREPVPCYGCGEPVLVPQVVGSVEPICDACLRCIDFDCESPEPAERVNG